MSGPCSSGLAPDLPEDFVRDGRPGLDLTGAITIEAGLVQHAAQTLARSLAGHLDETELADAIQRRLRLVLRESLLERPPDLVAIVVPLHVDQVEDHEAADVPEAQLIGDFVHCLQVGLERSLFQIAASLADEASGIDVDRRQSLRLIDDQIAAARQRHLA
jgi:hypothetical protein